jgi:hypothetical protein
MHYLVDGPPDQFAAVGRIHPNLATPLLIEAVCFSGIEYRRLYGGLSVIIAGGVDVNCTVRAISI